jgi:hypothetical protein
MITSDCISCGACEPECPNNAISQDENIYVIDPLLCTECVGFHDYEACAAVCPVDCCVTDPNNVEPEESLITRARAIHPETEFSPTFESRFRKGEGKGAAPAAKKGEPPKGQTATPPAARAAAAPPPAANVSGEEDIGAALGALPDIEDWQITVRLRCFRCGGSHAQAARHFMIGNVWFCPHCHRSMVVKDSLSFEIRTALKESYDQWEKERIELQAKREKDLRDFLEKRERELADRKKKEQQEIEKLEHQLKDITESYQAPGKAMKKRSLLGWG